MEIYNKILNLYPENINRLYSVNYFQNKVIFDKKLLINADNGLNFMEEEESDSFIELDKNVIYLIIDNLHIYHFWHYSLEIIMHLQLYLNYFKNKKICDKYQFNIISRPNAITRHISGMFEILEEDFILFVNPTDKFKGNFIRFSYLGHGSNILDDPPFPDIPNVIETIVPRGNFCLSIYDKLIEESNKRYKEAEKFDKLWVSRRNFDIKTYWHKRFITNIDEVAPTILENGFKEFHFPIEDIYRQIYLVNNSNVIFSEVGTSMANIFFMKKGSTFITDFDPNVLSYNHYIKLIAHLRGIELIVYDKTSNDDEAEQFYNLKRIENVNFPYKFDDPNDFNLWFDKVLKTC